MLAVLLLTCFFSFTLAFLFVLRVKDCASDVMGVLARNPDLDYVNPEKEVYIGLWCLQAGATAFLAARLWMKHMRRHGIWWDDYILVISWVRIHHHALPRELYTDFRIACPYDQRHHHHYRVRYWLCEPSLGYSDAHPHRHHLLPHSAWPKSYKDSFCSNATEVDQRLPVAARSVMVLHRHDERLEPGEGKKCPKPIPAVVTCAHYIAALDGVRMGLSLRRPGGSLPIPAEYLRP